MAKDTGPKKRGLENLEPLLNFRNPLEQKNPNQTESSPVGIVDREVELIHNKCVDGVPTSHQQILVAVEHISLRGIAGADP